jgi:hypothetical protein
MNETANFKVDTRLTSILGETYRSTEYALKELVDNAFDADADNVWIQLPKPLTDEPIVIKDDGSGMTKKEVENEYLFIANSRFSRKGEVTPKYKRKVKGRKGIGKFAGLVVASLMQVETHARSVKTTLKIDKEKILESKKDLEKVDLDISDSSCSENEKGTKITLSSLNQKLTFPSPEKLKQILIIEYGRQDDFNIFVDGQPLDVTDIPGETITETVILPELGEVKLKFTVTDGKKPLKYSGIAIRVEGKTIGKPKFFGLDKNEEIPRKLLRCIYGEVEADGLKGDTTADWGAILENSIAFQALYRYVQPKVEFAIKKQYKKEVNLQRARLKQKIDRELQKLPEHKRAFAEKAIEKVLKKFYNEPEDKVATIISVVLDAFDKDYYWEVMHHIDLARDSAVTRFAEALSEFGLLEMSLITTQAINRTKYLDYLDILSTNEATSEMDMHKAIEKNLWILGDTYSLIASNETLQKTIKRYTDKKFHGERADKRPDLFLSQNYDGKHLLIEFKKPTHTITRDDENQAEKYRDDLHSQLGIADIEIMVIGGSVSNSINSRYINENIKLLTFTNIIGKARARLAWLLKELNSESN